ncbi:MAG TPA: Sec-independent protein translocase protein TatB [Candidatus Polarisedimenticolia bacterium]|jgi:Tat protein translocase TatB subunit
MFGSIGGFEMLVLAIIGLLVFGPRRLPEIGRTLGKAMVEFRRAAMELRTSIEREVNLEEVRETTRTIQKAVGGDLLKDAAGLIPDLEEEAARIVREAAGPAPQGTPVEPGAPGEGEGQGTADVSRRS